MTVNREKLTADRDRVLKQALDCRLQLLAYARALLGNHASAEDAVQDAMLVVARKYDQFREGTSMLAWCRSIVRLEVLRVRQARQRQQSLTEKLLGDAIDSAFDEFQNQKRKRDEEMCREILADCMSRVGERGQKVLLLRFGDGLSYERIGNRVGLKLEAVRKTLYRLKKQVRGCVESKLRTAE